MYKVGYRDLVNNQKVSSWFFVKYITHLQFHRGSNKKMQEKEDSEIWLSNERIGFMKKTTTYNATHFALETVNLVPFPVS